MRISEMIESLQKYQKDYGDIPVKKSVYGMGFCTEDIKECSVYVDQKIVFIN